MDEMNVKMDCAKPKRSVFTRKFKILLGTAIFLASIEMLAEISCIERGIGDKAWNQMGMNSWTDQILFFICMAICFYTLICIAASKKTFSAAVVGLMFLVFGRITQYGAKDQQEMDTTI